MILAFAETVSEISSLVIIANDDQLTMHADALIASLR